MELQETCRIVARSTVAIVVKQRPHEPPGVPTIIGTGFVVGDGLVATNDHVIREVQALQQMPGASQHEWPIAVVLFYLVPEKGMYQLQMNVRGTLLIETFKAEGNYYGERPDLGFLHVDMRGLPSLKIADSLENIGPGQKVATLGFPMGTDALRAPDYVHQICPTLQEGIVSAVLPFPCRTPHALMLNLMTQGGASGSPIFLPNSPEVIGVLYAGLRETYSAEIQGIEVPYQVPTMFTYCVAGHFLRAFLEDARLRPELRLSDDSPHFDEVLTVAGK